MRDPVVARSAPPAPSQGAATWATHVPAGQVRSVMGRSADVLTLAGAVLAPSYGLGFGGRTGFAFADAVLGLAGMARILHLLVAGVPIERVRRHSFLLGVLAVFATAGLVSGLANGQPVSVVYVFTVVSTLGALVLVTTYGGPTRHVVVALGAGYLLLAVSGVVGPTHQGRAIGFSVHPNALGHSCVMGWAVAMWLFDGATTRRQRWLWGGTAVLQVVVIVLSGSRGGTLGVVLAAVVYLALRGDHRLTLAAVGTVWLAALALATGAVQLSEGNPLQRQLTESASSTGSDEARRQLLQQDLEHIAEDPFFGEGFDAIVNVHVVYFQGWIGGGAVCGLALMLLGATMLSLPFWARRRDLALACGAMGVAVMWLFTNILTARDQWLFLTLVFASAPSLARLVQRQPLRRSQSDDGGLVSSATGT